MTTRIVMSLAAATTVGVGLLLAPLSRGATPPVSRQSTTLHYTAYTAPAGVADQAGEPSLGIDPATGTGYFLADTALSTVTFNAQNQIAWKPVTLPATESTTSLDPIGFTDQRTGRTFVSQLAGATSLLAYSDDGGKTFTQGVGSGLTTAFDHQSLGAGPYHGAPPLTKVSSYPDAVYYCAQADVKASCARSDDGGMTFTDGTPIYTSLGIGGAPACAGLHGHLKVAPNGTVYVPNFDCDGHAAVTVSTDNGLTWTVHEVLASHTKQDESDPSLGIASDGTVYLAYEDGDSSAAGSHIEVVVSHDQGTTWSTPVDVGAAFGINNVQFPETVAGDPDRAAVAFLGAQPVGDDQLKNYPGIYHLYVAHTYDTGATWEVADATPTDPVQRGGINLQGTSGGAGDNAAAVRNLLDFNDETIDKQGRVYVGYADGCTGACITSAAPADNNYVDQGSVARQDSGRGVFAAYDSVLAPAAPTSTAPTSTAPTSTAPTSAAPGSPKPTASATATPKPTSKPTATSGSGAAGRLPIVKLVVSPKGARVGDRIVVTGQALLRGRPVAFHVVRLTFRADGSGKRTNVAFTHTDAKGLFRFPARLYRSGAFQAQLAYGVSSAHNREVFVRARIQRRLHRDIGGIDEMGDIRTGSYAA